MAFQVVKGYTGLLYEILCNSIFHMLEKQPIASLTVFVHSFGTFISNFLLCLVNFCYFLSYLKLRIRKAFGQIKGSIAKIKTLASEKFLNDWNSAPTKFGKSKIFCDYGLKLLLNVILPLADFVTDVYFAISVYGDNDWFFEWSGIFLLHGNFKIENQISMIN